MAAGVILGIDPGLNGALALLFPDNTVKTFDMPVRPANRGRELDERGLARIIDAHSRDIDFALLERQWARPVDGGAQAFKLGCTFGGLRMVLASNFIPYDLIAPAVWKRFMSVGFDKTHARGVASRLFPKSADQWVRKMDDGRAEAALLAYYGRSHPVRVTEAA